MPAEKTETQRKNRGKVEKTRRVLCFTIDLNKSLHQFGLPLDGGELNTKETRVEGVKEKSHLSLSTPEMAQ